MSNRKLAKAIQGLFRALRKLHHTVTKGLVNWLLRSALKNNRGNRLASGFVLPTTVLLVLVVALTVGALTYRAYNRNAQVIGQNQQRIIYNAATPAIDRARSKLEFLFDATKDNRYPGGVPGEDRLLAMLLNKPPTGGNTFAQVLVPDAAGVLTDPYTLPDETRVDLNGDKKSDNAWSFRTDTNGDGTSDATVVYSVIFSSPVDPAKPNANPQELLLTSKDVDKAKNLWVRHGPLIKESNAVKCGSGSGGAEGGWFEDPGNTSILRKNFQVDATVIPDVANSTAVTLEFHQDRQLNRGNKWGAWFRNDLEIFPGPIFNWNGAMHTEGSLMIGNSFGEKKFTAHLISAPASCLFSPADNSGITVTDTPGFKGSVIAGMMGSSNAGASDIYLYGNNPIQSKELNTGSDSTTLKPIEVSLDPVEVLVRDKNAYRDTATTVSSTNNWANIKNPGLGERIISKGQDKPYVDDLYRADDRWGPKPKYGTGTDAVGVPTGDMGKDIPSSRADLILKDDPSSTGSGVGLDGYWERRARGNGLRILVGERLELGNLNTWVTPRDTNGDLYIPPNATGSINESSDEREGDPLYPPTIAPYPTASGTALKHLDLQRRTLRDNLSAVQATAVYHSAINKDYPVACLTSTVHPGTLSTLSQSINFKPTRFADGQTGTIDYLGNLTSGVPLQSNFFTGQGTNGWEFSAPSGSAAAFETAMNSATSPLRTALQNLANFAGDPDGVFPLAPTVTDKVHPYPALSMWGNYSNLRRVLGKLTAGTAYTDLSISDKTYLQTASCTLGVLAYNIDTIQKFNPTNVNNDYDLGSNHPVLIELAKNIQLLMDGDESNGEVLPKGQIGGRDYDPNSTRTGAIGDRNKDTDYTDVPPEAWIGALKQKRLKDQYLGASATYQEALASTLTDPQVRMAELIMLKYQIRRDRAFGFRSSPAFGTYVGQAAGTKVIADGTSPRAKYRLPSACDPDDFRFTGLSASLGQTAGALAKEGEYRLALSRLCGGLDTTNYDPDDLTQNKRAWVLPKFPALYYIFPEKDHPLAGALDLSGGVIYDHRQPGETTLSLAKTAPDLVSGASLPISLATANSLAKNDNRAVTDQEPYVKDTYVANAKVNGSVTFKVVGTSAIAITPPVLLPTTLPLTPTLAAASGNTPSPSRYPYLVTSPFPVADYALGSSIALTPTPLASWKLPHPAPNTTTVVASGGPNVTPNIIVSTDGAKVAVPFLDRAIFDGRQVMLMRSLDIDLGMLRSNGIGSDVWLPESGIVYAFREDAVREDAIVRPTGTDTDLRNPANPTDPPLDSATGISKKAVDFITDPERRIHGFRLRNGSEIKRKGSLLEDAKNIRGLSFFTDQPVFIQGDFNLHQSGREDEPSTEDNRLEEFFEKLPGDTDYTAKQFYKDRTTTNYDNFSVPSKDRWRPSEILADSIGILSNDFCDGSIADTFVIPDLNKNVADFKLVTSDNFDPSSNPRDQYNDVSKLGLFGPGCAKNGGKGYTSFHNRNIPRNALPTNGDWVRENSSNATLPQRNSNYLADFTSPIKISRAGQPLIQASQAGGANATQPPLPRPVLYNTKGTYQAIGDGDKTRKLTPAIQTRVNSIVVSGIVPSREWQSYGGLHNFPRFLEDWGDRPLNFAGSFLQLNFSNHGTGPFESEAWEVGQDVDSGSQNLQYYSPPKRLWGYDVGLQLSPAGPAATRFVISSKNRNEFYSEPPVNDPYINMLCRVVKTTNSNVNCPSQPGA
ncbi:hormogonium polysaccharide biosynthesis protein HpsA [Phormidesmis priestleyi]|uniref:hormogonium polysaccharide biosynthesis protein HpsA n=1 Tax=Phormidesmis priestleyi TaxID=268141 RepID=UPI00083B6858|nr:hormogonium polysaccharide biosynthesis protein HpsA [Phormidesmis priestleyi]